MRIIDLPRSVSTLWAKSGEPDGHPLLLHMLDVAAVAETLLGRESDSTLAWAAFQFGFERPDTKRWLAALIGLHDFGKASSGFQAKWPEGQLACEQAGFRFFPDALARNRHDIATAALLREHLLALDIEFDWARDVVQAVSAHHGFNFLTKEVSDGKPILEGDEWRGARRVLFNLYWQTLVPQGLPTRDQLALPAVEWLAGLTSLCDWIGSNAEWFPLGARANTLVEHFDEARQRAEAALEAIGWSAFAALQQKHENTDALLTRVLRKPHRIEARPLQAAADQLLAEGAGPALLVVEAPMGEGKTELAFLAHLRLQARNGHRGLYVALPTQATGNAMFDRALDFLQSFADGMRLDIQLAHGGALLDERVIRLRNLWGRERDEQVSSSAWFSKRRRALLSPYGVGTVDHALFAALNVKHHFVRLWGLANKVVVLDEVHAYDTYTTNLIEALLRWLKALGCSVVLMSATLPAAKRQGLFEAWGMGGALPLLAYPRVLLADGSGLHGTSFGARQQESIHISGVEETVEALAATAMRLLENDGCGAVIVNTVDRAQKLYSLLRKQVGPDTPLVLFHARFPADERQASEQRVLQLFGPPDGMRQRPKRALLVATQVAEQSLDIDFDFLISDLAPVDLLLQRAGRLHRHMRPDRPAMHRTPQLWIAGLLPDRLPELKTTAWKHVYGEYLCLVTWAVLQREPVWRLPDDIDRLVQAVYAGEPVLEGLPPDIEAHITEVSRWEQKAAEDCERQMAKNVVLNAGDEACNAYVGKPPGGDEEECFGLRNRTRLGEDSVSVVPLHEDEAGLWHQFADSPGIDRNQPASEELARQLFSRQLKLSRKGVPKALREQPKAPLFTEHPLIANLLPLLLRDGQCQLGRHVLQLDPELGLCYRNTSSEEQA